MVTVGCNSSKQYDLRNLPDFGIFDQSLNNEKYIYITRKLF